MENQDKEQQILTNDDITKLISVDEFEEISLSEVAETLSLTMRGDDDNKIITFLGMLSAYTATSQINISFNAPSSSGKTYLASETAKFFPIEDKIELSGASPTSFFYGEGKLDKKRKAKIVSLERKILIFYEQPNSLLQEKLRAVLSHDSWETKHRMTNKDKKGANRAELVILQGFPSSVWCSAAMRLDEQETTRFLLLSPEVSEAKIRNGISLQARRGANQAEYDKWLDTEPKRAALKRRVLGIRQEHVGDIIVPNPDAVVERFYKAVPVLKPRHMRDVDHLMRIIKAITLLNVWFRKSKTGDIIATESDVDEAFQLWEKFFESQNLNLPPAVLQIYKKFIVPAYIEKYRDNGTFTDMGFEPEGLSRSELLAYYFSNEGRAMNDDQLRKEVLPQLENTGLIVQEKPQVGDKRSMHIFPQWFPDNNDPRKPNNVGEGGGSVDMTDEAIKQFFGS